MSDMKLSRLEPDQELGTALREALASHHDGAFLTRVRARMSQRARSWDEELAHWFWRGLAAATAAMAFAGFGLSKAAAATLPEETVEASAATQLLEGSTPGSDVLFLAMQTKP